MEWGSIICRENDYFVVSLLCLNFRKLLKKIIHEKIHNKK